MRAAPARLVVRGSQTLRMGLATGVFFLAAAAECGGSQTRPNLPPPEYEPPEPEASSSPAQLADASGPLRDAGVSGAFTPE
jgi:hypothetical protein